MLEKNRAEKRKATASKRLKQWLLTEQSVVILMFYLNAISLTSAQVRG
jgi:hypothetical protein